MLISSRLRFILAILVVAIVTITYHVGFNGRSGEECGELLVYAAIATQKPLNEIVELFESENCVDVNIVYESSGKLLSMLEFSRRGDIYISADPYYMDLAVEKGLVDSRSISRIASLKLAVIVPRDNPANISSLYDLTKPGIKIGIAEENTVAVGRYTKKLLTSLGIYNEVKKNVVVYASNFGHLMNLVITDSVDAVIGWNIGYCWYPNETIAIDIDSEYNLSYIVGGITVFSENIEKSREFLLYISSSRVENIWRKYCYGVSS